ncbi:MAG: protoporphyrinogen oxidase [Actinomycetota bacterium]|nr:protoporphyrinogen oxidase [Actinomycetota bacterium]MEE3205294.1 protoporphyrinogen oxidase [Actinomycetota bacterium]
MVGSRVVVVGAGISGLTAAHRLVVDHPELTVTVLEADPRVGGALATSSLEGTGLEVDEGADAFLVRVPWAADLCAELGLGEELVVPSARRASLWLDGALRPLPAPNVLGLPLDPSTVAPGILDAADLNRLAGTGHPDVPLGDGDLSVGAVVRACVGDAVHERLVDPLLGGVNAGRADDLSCTTMAPQLLAAARSGDGLLGSLRATHRSVDPTAPVFNAPRDGMGRLVAALAGRLGDRVHRNTPVVSLNRVPDGWAVGTADSGAVVADAVVVATPAHAAAALLAPVAPDGAGILAEFVHASVALTTVAFRRADLAVPEDRSGFLVGRSEGLLMTACSFADRKWSHLDDGNHTVLRVSCGRVDDNRPADLDDRSLSEALLADLATTLGTDARPSALRVSRWPRSLVQFPVGHARRIAEVDRDLSDRAPGVVLAGAVRYGVGIPACIRSGTEAATAAAIHRT